MTNAINNGINSSVLEDINLNSRQLLKWLSLIILCARQDGLEKIIMIEMTKSHTDKQEDP